MRVAIRPTLLIIADIGGYTKFMSVHRINLAHAQYVVAQLLEAILDASAPLELAKLEGDAAFLYAPLKGDRVQLSGMVASIRAAFLARRRELELDRVCSCDGCVQVSQLDLKFVAHQGEVAEQRVKQHRELAGVPVITVHRLLKNNVPVREYVLMTDEVYTHLEEPLRQHARTQQEELEGLGEARTWYLDLSETEPLLPPAPPPSWWRRWRKWAWMTLRSLPYFIGLKRACVGYRNLGAIGHTHRQGAHHDH